MAPELSPSTTASFESACITEKGESTVRSPLSDVPVAESDRPKCCNSTDSDEASDANHPDERAPRFLKLRRFVWQQLGPWLKPLAPNLSPSKAPSTVTQLEDYPVGYPSLSWFLSSDDSFMMYRGFHQLQSRVLLQKQDELREMEEELLGYDWRDNDDENIIYLQNRASDQARNKVVPGKSRCDILRAIDAKLEEYTRCLKRAHFVQDMNKPADRDHASVSHYFHNNAPLAGADRDFVKRKEDLVSIRSGREHAWLDALVEAVLRWYPCAPIKYMFCSEESRAKTNDPQFHYFSRKRIGLFVTLLITILVSVLLVAPTFALLHLTVKVGTDWADNTCIALLLACTLVFSIVLSLFTKAKRHEILAAAIAYCAVLVVFVANIGNIGNNAGLMNQG